MDNKQGIVLIVDDNDSLAEDLKDYLESFFSNDFKIEVRAWTRGLVNLINGQQAERNELALEDIRMVILDVVLPLNKDEAPSAQHSEDLTKLIEAKYKNIAVKVITAHPDQLWDTQKYNVVKDVLTKPINYNEIKENIEMYAYRS